jgi:hypothetical protein
MKLLIMQFSPTSCHFIPLRSKCPQRPVLNHPVFVPPLMSGAKFSHTYRITGKIIVYACSHTLSLYFTTLTDVIFLGSSDNVPKISTVYVVDVSFSFTLYALAAKKLM